LVTAVGQSAQRPDEVAELVAGAGRLVPLLLAHAAEVERRGRLTDEVTGALRDGGWLTLAAPRRFGGREIGARALVEVCTELGRGCGSSAWVVNVVAGGAFLTSLFDDQARLDVWGSGTGAPVCASLTPTGTAKVVDGGLVVNGRWHFASGIHQAQWICAAVAVLDEQGAVIDQRVALLPVGEVAIEPTWRVAGMKGTGSDSFVVADLFVPEHRTLSMGRALAGGHAPERPDEPGYRAPLSSFLAVPLTGPVLGMARAALEHTLATLAKGKPLSLSTYDHAADSPSVQLAMADAASLIDTATLHALRAADDMDGAARAGTALDVQARARIRMDTAVAMSRAREAVELLLTVGGASSFAEVNPIQRIWRDLGTASRHAVASSTLSREIYGRALLGIEQQVTSLI
jgi:3-hydroxy-9,10-secoandrosta-1,3,5(10)-triene-9,17-dione monooxygenase